MKFCFITNDLSAAKWADGIVDRVMIDLEFIGKSDRQTGKNLFQSEHTIGDVSRIKSVLFESKLMVRINSVHQNTVAEINEVIERGADIVMLPYFKSAEEIELFVSCTNKRVRTSLLIETKEAVSVLPKIIEYADVDEYHIGLNDLALSLHKENIFHTILDGDVQHCVQILQHTKKPYGFGGISSLSSHDLPINPILFLSEQVRSGCSIGWLGRSFRSSIHSEHDMRREVAKLREAISQLSALDMDSNHDKLMTAISGYSASVKPYRI